MATTETHYTQTTPTDNNKWTFSCWFKKAAPSSEMSLFGAWSDGNNQSKCRLMTNGTIEFIEYQSSSTVGKLTTNRALRDPSAWMHIVCVYDSDNGTPADRMKMYINGVRETSFSVDTNPSSGLASINNVSGRVMYVGRDYDGGYWQGCMSHVQFVDGLALAPTEFGEFDSTSGIWKIKTGSYATPGNNGFHLKMEDASNLDLDSSSNAHTFTTSGTLTATKDNPSNNFATFNPLCVPVSNSSTLSNGNLTGVTSTSSADWGGVSTLGLDGGKWYYEFLVLTSGNDNLRNIFGISSDPAEVARANTEVFNKAYAYCWKAYNSAWWYNTSGSAVETTSYFNTFTNGDYMGCYIDLDNNTIAFAKNGTLERSGVSNSIASVSTAGTYFPIWTDGHSGWSSSINMNFGNGVFGTTALTGSEDSDWFADAGGIGRFKYNPTQTVDSVSQDYRAICTKNIKAYGG